MSGDELVSAIEIIHRGEPYITQALASRLLTRNKGQSLLAEKAIDMGVTLRDKQVLSHLARGLTNQEIATEMGVNVRTIKYYLTQVFRKMRVRNRVEAILEAQKLRLELDGHSPS